MRDPRLADLSTHVKILDAKLNSNLIAIDDFKYLLIETKKENIPHKDILVLLTLIEEALDEAKNSLLKVNSRRNEAKTLM